MAIYMNEKISMTVESDDDNADSFSISDLAEEVELPQPSCSASTHSVEIRYLSVTRITTCYRPFTSKLFLYTKVQAYSAMYTVLLSCVLYVTIMNYNLNITITSHLLNLLTIVYTKRQ
ncbi:hypothetical protein EDC94DRAFT_654149 [Helicostylum pulchrum]|nr:hypothetical protein EDC94DRAFT_654149 [Helicostylum pulchrum]